MKKNSKKRSLIKNLKNFFDDVKKETKKVIWTSKKNLFRYSLITILFMVFICLFFVGTDLIIALVSYVKELIN